MPSTRPPVDYIERTRAQYEDLGYPPYQWVHSDDAPPFVPLRKPLEKCRVALIGSGGIYERGQIAFHFKDDLSFRIIDTTAPTAHLRATHFAYDLTDARMTRMSCFRSTRCTPWSRTIASVRYRAMPTHSWAVSIHRAKCARNSHRQSLTV